MAQNTNLDESMDTGDPDNPKKRKKLLSKKELIEKLTNSNITFSKDTKADELLKLCQKHNSKTKKVIEK